MRFAHVADVQHDAVGRRHDAKAGVGEQREHRHRVAAGHVLPHHQEHDDQHAEDQRRFDAEPRQARRPRAALFGGAEIALDVTEALFEERLPPGDLDVLDRAEALLQQVQLLLIQLAFGFADALPRSTRHAQSARARAASTIATVTNVIGGAETISTAASARMITASARMLIAEPATSS